MKENENSIVRFGSRSLMALLALASVILAITVPYTRRLPIELQSPMYWTIGIAGAVALVVFLGMCLYRLWIERLSGALLFQPKQTFWIRWIFACLMVPVLGGILVANGWLMANLYSTISGIPDQISDQVSVMPIKVISVGILLVPIFALIVSVVLPFWGLGIMALEVREKGVIVSGWKFYPWMSGVKFEWQPSKKPNVAVLAIKRGKRKNIAIIQSDEREELEQHLSEFGITVSDLNQLK